MIWIWLGLIITLILIEISIKNLVTIWYAGSAVISLILSLFIDSYLIEFSIFALIGTILLFTARDSALKKIKDIKKKKRVK